MNDTDTIDRELERLVEGLPEPLRGDWVVVPRRFLVQTFLAALLLGGALALLVVGFVLDVEALKWAWPVVLFSLMLAAKYVTWWRGDRFAAHLRDLRRGPPSGSTSVTRPR